MPIKDATPEQIRAMKERIYKKQDDRLAEQQMDEVVRMVQRRPFVSAPVRERRSLPSLEDAVDLFGSLAAAALAALLVNTGAVPLPYGLSVMLVFAIGGTLTIFKK